MAIRPTPLLEETSSSFTPKVSVSYFAIEDIHFYATAAEGFRVGQINFGATPANGIPVSFDPDSLWNYEVGMKSIWQEGRLSLMLLLLY